MAFIILWVVLSAFAGLTGRGKNLGFWGIFAISLIFSPLIGFIIGIVSSKKNASITPYINVLNEAKMAENRDELEEALKKYKDTEYLLNQTDWARVNKPIANSRLKARQEVQDKIKELSKVISNDE